MARKTPNPASETLEEFESFLDRTAQKIADNPFPFAAGVGTILLVTLIVSVANAMLEKERLEASEAVGLVQGGFLAAMGAPPLSPTFTEPANPETARATREDFAARLQAAADEYPGTAAAAAGRIEAATLLAELGDEEGARAVWRTAADEAPADSALRAAALFRLAGSLESSDLGEASRLYETASRIDDYPAGGVALAHAARTALDAGEGDRALEIFDELLEEAGDDERLIAAPPFVTARLRELRASQLAAPID